MYVVFVEVICLCCFVWCSVLFCRGGSFVEGGGENCKNFVGVFFYFVLCGGSSVVKFLWISFFLDGVERSRSL